MERWENANTQDPIGAHMDSLLSNNEGLYFTWDGVGINPIAEVDEVEDPTPDSPFGTLSGRSHSLRNRFPVLPDAFDRRAG